MRAKRRVDRDLARIDKLRKKGNESAWNIRGLSCVPGTIAGIAAD